MEEFESLKNKFKGSNKYMITLDYEEIKRIIEITENLIARNKELEKSYVEEAQLFLNTLNYYYIPKSKVREKIEELKKEYQEKINKLMQEHEMLGDYASRLLIEEEQDRKKQKYNYERGE